MFPASKLCLSVLPSMAICSGDTLCCSAVFASSAWTASIQERNPCRNASGSSCAKTRVNVSCDGMPLGRSSLSLNQSFFERPKSSISTKSSAPQRTAHKAMVRMSESRWRFLLLTLGSGRSAKCAAMPVPVLDGLGAADRGCPSAGSCASICGRTSLTDGQVMESSS